MPDLLAILIYSPRLSSIHAGLLTHRTRRAVHFTTLSGLTVQL